MLEQIFSLSFVAGIFLSGLSGLIGLISRHKPVAAFAILAICGLSVGGFFFLAKTAENIDGPEVLGLVFLLLALSALVALILVPTLIGFAFGAPIATKLTVWSSLACFALFFGYLAYGILIA